MAAARHRVYIACGLFQISRLRRREGPIDVEQKHFRVIKNALGLKERKFYFVQ